MKRKTFLLAVIAMAVNGLDKSFGATKKPTPKPKVTAKVTPIPKATPKHHHLQIHLL